MTYFGPTKEGQEDNYNPKIVGPGYDCLEHFRPTSKSNVRTKDCR